MSSLLEANQQPHLIVTPTRGWHTVDLRDLWRYRELVHIFAWRDFKVRYRQTLLGVLWVVGQPLLSMIIFTILFNRVAKFRADNGAPYPLFVLSGLLIWNFISGTIAKAGNSLIGSSFLISKVYFPRLIIPLSTVIGDAIDFLVGAILLLALMIGYRVTPTPQILLAPFVLAVAAALALGTGLWIAALNVEYRDVRVIVPFALQLAMYLTPVVYPLSALPGRYRAIAIANPATGVIESFRSAVLGTPLHIGALVWSVTASTFVLVAGSLYFRRMERLFADML